MTLPTEQIDAMRQCLRIIVPTRPLAMRETMVLNIETHIQQGRWFPAFELDHIPILFFPHDKQKADAMLLAMEEAYQSGKLPGRLTRKYKRRFWPSDLVAWTECPQVPEDSPLRFWLPAFMQADVKDPKHLTPLAKPTSAEAGNAQAIQVNAMKKAALIDAYGHEWPSINTDLSDATRNGLKVAAHAGVHGQWDSDKARAWAVTKGKIKQDAPVHSLAAAWPSVVTRHRISG